MKITVPSEPLLTKAREAGCWYDEDDFDYYQRLPGDVMYGFVDGNFIFQNRKELWRAASTPDHPLSCYAKWIAERRFKVSDSEFILVNCYFEPPIILAVSNKILSPTEKLIIYLAILLVIIVSIILL
jgi:hypothetical protein